MTQLTREAMSDGVIYGQLTGDMIRRHFENIKEGMIAAMAQKGRNASYRSIQSLEIRADDKGGELTGSKSWVAMERGRKGGRVPASFYEIILQWAIQKGIRVEPIPYKTDRPHKYTPQQRGLMSFAWIVSRRIMREGTSLYRNQGFDDIYSGLIERELKAMERELAGIAETEVRIMESKITS